MSSLFLLIPDASLREAVREQLAVAKIGSVHSFDTTQALLDRLASDNPTIIVLEADGQTPAVLEKLNLQTKKPAIVALADADAIEGVTETFAKPFRLGHLLTRLRYYLDTAPLLRDQTIAFGAYRLEPQQRRVTGENLAEPVRLTEKETALLVFLATRTEPPTRRDILAAVWGYEEKIDTHTLETHIYQLRRKLENNGEPWLINEAGTYRLTLRQA